MSGDRDERRPAELPEGEVRALVERARAGDREAFGDLVRLYQAPALTVALRVVRRPEDARDAVQEAFLRAFRYLASYRARQGTFRTWLLSIVVHEALDRQRALRDRTGEMRDVPFASPATAAPGPDETLLGSETRRVLEGLLDHLTPRERAAFVLKDVEGWSTRRVARALGCGPVTVRRHLSRARRRLRELLRTRHPELLARYDRD
jgi:RNA polymerase sigma-70 factor (ECF subfamily)